LSDPHRKRPGGRSPAQSFQRSGSRLPRLLRRLGAGDDGRLGPKHVISYWIIYQKFIRRRSRVRDAVELAAVSILLGPCRVRSPIASIRRR